MNPRASLWVELSRAIGCPIDLTSHLTVASHGGDAESMYDRVQMFFEKRTQLSTMVDKLGFDQVHHLEYPATFATTVTRPLC